jgi:hypothetical protein
MVRLPSALTCSIRTGPRSPALRACLMTRASERRRRRLLRRLTGHGQSHGSKFSITKHA